jgi:xanthine dehydrogenase accessory factor
MHAGTRLGRDAGTSGAAAVIGAELSRRAQELAAERSPFVVATVVRVQRPASIEPGNVGLVHADGTIEGFIGGICAQHSVRLHSLEAIEAGMPLLLRVLPDGEEEIVREEGVVTVTNPCLSGGAIEIFLDPVLPAPRVLVAGDSPIVAALRTLGPEIGLEIVAAQDIRDGVLSPTAGDLALVVAAHGNDEVATLRAGLEAGVRYVGLVASRKRGATVIAELREEDVADELIDALETPAGLDIGARTPAEVALSILARIVAVRRSVREAAAPAPAPTAVDPICGMTVVVGAGTPSLEHDGGSVYFCCEGCRHKFEEERGLARSDG